MPTITLSDAAFAELKTLAAPSAEAPESLAAKLIHQEVVRRGTQSNGNEPVSETVGKPPHVRTPRLADPQQATDFRKQVVEIPADAEV